MRTHITHTLGAAAAGTTVLLALAGVGTASAAASAARCAYPVTAYVIDSGSDTVTPICTATNTALKAISVGQLPAAIAITPNGRTV